MKKSETEKSVGEKLEAPIQLTPEQLETAAGGMRAQVGKGQTATTGAVSPKPPIPKADLI
jgi:hypothetical protein